MEQCKKCGLVKTWEGGEVNCPFQNGFVFGENWNCGVVNKIREICDAAEDGNDYRLHYQNCEGQQYTTINIDNVGDIGLCLWVTWYKRRGGTDSMWILTPELPPRLPTFKELEEIINHYGK